MAGLAKLVLPGGAENAPPGVIPYRIQPVVFTIVSELPEAAVARPRTSRDPSIVFSLQAVFYVLLSLQQSMDVIKNRSIGLKKDKHNVAVAGVYIPVVTILVAVAIQLAAGAAGRRRVYKYRVEECRRIIEGNPGKGAGRRRRRVADIGRAGIGRGELAGHGDHAALGDPVNRAGIDVHYG